MDAQAISFLGIQNNIVVQLVLKLTALKIKMYIVARLSFTNPMMKITASYIELITQIENLMSLSRVEKLRNVQVTTAVNQPYLEKHATT